MNKPSFKYYAHTGLKYNFLLKIYGLYFKRTEPYKYMNDENSLLNQMIHNRDKTIEEYEEIILQESNEILS